jgi:hypothetical protein
MSGLAAFAGELACERITPAELSEIKALLKRRSRAASKTICRAFQLPQPRPYMQDQRCREAFGLRQTHIAVNRPATGATVPIPGLGATPAFRNSIESRRATSSH